MENIKQEFQTDIQNLLSNYLDEQELKIFNDKIAKNGINNKSLGVINEFYSRQLKVEYDFVKERMEIDRTITFANKNLDKKRFVQVLLKLGQVCTGHGKLNLAFEVLNKAVKESESYQEKAESLLLLSDVHSRRAEWRVSVETLNEAKKLFKLVGNSVGEAKCENMLGSIYGERGELEEAKAHFIHSLACWESEQDKEMSAVIEGNLGIIENIQGNHTSALDYFYSAMKKFELLGSYRRIAELKHNVGMLYVNQDMLNEALAEFDKCINISLKEGLLPVLSTVYLSKANVLIKMEDFDASLVFADKSMEIAHQIDDKLTIADVYKTKSNIEIHFGNYDKAENYLLTSLALNEKMKNVLNMAESCTELGMLYGKLNLKVKKEDYLQRSLKYFREAQAIDSIQKVEEMLGTSAKFQ
jgi:tetratricopeptide (TPR) repeat protein